VDASVRRCDSGPISSARWAHSSPARATLCAALETLEHAYRVGDHRTARALARRVLSESADPALQERARTILAQTEPDRFLPAIGALGLGLVAWLVYNYVP
jgi:hypothetical protein